ncbi:hypothetical protein CK203_071829 [Vitis vinifera]|uniref:Uncharacterized protein n=1 Tax=Vitis vinifera TaxID=29760 RepID=A0A438C3P4_VITVI|nr:hypothetical protein CK203_071829 [Vitis vinifera]
MTALLLLDCMSLVRVGRTSIPLPPTLLVSVIPFISVLTIASHSGGERHFGVDWSPIIEDLYSSELDFMDIRATSCFLSRFSFLGFSDAPTPFTVHSSWLLSVESFERFHHRKPLGCRGSVCVEVMTTLHGSAPSLRRRAEGCVPPEGLPPYTWVHLRAFRASVVISDPVFPLFFSLQLRVLGDRSLFVVPVLVQCPGLRGIDQFELEDGYSPG